MPGLDTQQAETSERRRWIADIGLEVRLDAKRLVATFPARDRHGAIVPGRYAFDRRPLRARLLTLAPAPGEDEDEDALLLGAGIRGSLHAEVSLRCLSPLRG